MTRIEWTNETWNPIIGCSKVSPGCDNCYAEKMANRLADMSLKDDSSEYFDYSGIGAYAMVTLDGKWNGKTQLVSNALNKPAKWKKPRMIFVCSMGDLFHESVKFTWIDTVFSIMSDNDHHIYQILTKRPDRMREFFYWKKDWSGYNWQPKETIWLGVTAENQEQANKRIPVLLQTPAAVRFVSCEPLLSSINIFPLQGEMSAGQRGLDWVICGGESGPKARPMHPDWVRSLRDQCKAAGVPFFFKQWGEWTTSYMVPVDLQKVKQTEIDDTVFYKVGKKIAGRRLNGVEHNEFPKIK